jgi:hypothetical protein
MNAIAGRDLDDHDLVRVSVNVRTVEEFDRVADGGGGELDGRLAPLVHQAPGRSDPNDAPVFDPNADEAALGVGERYQRIGECSALDARAFAIEPLTFGVAPKPFHTIEIGEQAKLLQRDVCEVPRAREHTLRILE